MSVDLVLASGSPRRRDLLKQVGCSFTVCVPNILEERRTGESPADYVQRNATEKATVVLDQRPDSLVIAADTVVVLGETVLEKPSTEEEACSMIAQLSGRAHQVMTGFCVGQAQRRVTSIVRTDVQFRRLSAAEIAAYVARGESLDKAGAYAAQGFGVLLVESIQGSYTNVVGLPMAALAAVLRDSFGFDLLVQDC